MKESSKHLEECAPCHDTTFQAFMSTVVPSVAFILIPTYKGEYTICYCGNSPSLNICDSQKKINRNLHRKSSNWKHIS